jgi:demethylmenaquinone methyltransferase/2-methoxy-6-polyprenyl-1,4-benzoquinol methylase
VLLSYGRDAHWKRHMVALAGPVAGRAALDLACGTGDITFLLADRHARVIGLDLTPRMIELARAKGRTRQFRIAPTFIVGDMCALPFGAASFDLVTTGYGLRNVPDLPGALSEIRRVLRPAGVLLSLDFNRPASAPVRLAYHAYLTAVGATLGLALHRDPNTYRYIPESIRTYPGADGVVRLLEQAGFVSSRWQRVLGGLMAIHEARAPC